MLPVLKMASVHNVELVKFFFKLLYQADTQKPEVKGIYSFFNSFKLICYVSEEFTDTIRYDFMDFCCKHIKHEFST